MVKGLLIQLASLSALLQLLSSDASEVLSQILPAVGQVLLFETPSTEIWIAGAVPTASLWLRWLGSSWSGMLVFNSRNGTKRKEKRDGRQDRQCSKGAVMNSSVFPAPFRFPGLTSSEAQAGCWIFVSLPDKNRRMLFNYLWSFWSLASPYWQNKYCNLA